MNRIPYLMPALLIAGLAAARGADGRLDVLITPRDGAPALILPGGTFDVVATAQCALRAERDGEAVDLPVTWSPLPGNRFAGRCATPATMGIGLWSLTAVAGGKRDTNVRSICVVSAFPEQYALAHVSDVHIGSNRHKRTSEDIFRDLVTKLNEMEAAFVLITGDVTQDGKADQFQSFVSILDTINKPTFVCSGNHDRDALNYEQFFGPDAYVFWFGKDAYLAHDTKDFNVAPDMGTQNNDLQVMRRAMKPARWSIGFSHRYEPSQGMRSQLIMFVDDPLDHLIFGHWHQESLPNEKVIWKTTPYTVTSAAINGKMRLFSVSSEGIKPQPVLSVAPIE
jgi:predicted phosphodiesterase